MYQRYPLVMYHPNHQRARKIADAVPAIPPAPGRPLIQAQPEQWEPERYGPMTVQNEDQEAYHAAKGYKAAGTPDPKAFESATANPYVPGREAAEWPKMINGVLTLDPNAPKVNQIQEYPKWITPPQGDALLVKSQEEEEKWLALWTAPPEKKPQRKGVDTHG